MPKQIKFRRDTETPFETRVILAQLLLVNKGEGGSIKDMAEKVELMERIQAGPVDGDMVFSDSEYDRLKGLYEANGFPTNNRFFLTVWDDIKKYTSVDKPKAAEGDKDANKA